MNTNEMHFDSARGVEAKADSSVLGECGADRATLPRQVPLPVVLQPRTFYLPKRNRTHTHRNAFIVMVMALLLK